MFVICNVHSCEPAALHCRDCKQLICLLCSHETTHKTHSAETIEEALHLILPVVKENQLKVKAKTDDTKSCIEVDKTQQTEMKMTCDDARAQLTTKQDEAVADSSAQGACAREDTVVIDTDKIANSGCSLYF